MWRFAEVGPSVVEPPTTARARITALALRSTAFTLGHSLSLSLAASGTLNPPSRLVETGIAVTVFVTAMHVARPCIPHRAETAIALLFGLIHGFGFSSTLGNLGLTGRALIVPTVGFNIGLEVAQLAADVVLSLPLWWLARRRWSNIGIAVPAMAVAGSWIIQRGLNTSNPLEPLVNVVVATPERLAFIIGLFAAASAGYAAQRRRRVAEDFESSYIALRESPR